jgi:hypothetical protein
MLRAFDACGAAVPCYFSRRAPPPCHPHSQVTQLRRGAGTRSQQRVRDSSRRHTGSPPLPAGAGRALARSLPACRRIRRETACRRHRPPAAMQARAWGCCWRLARRGTCPLAGGSASCSHARGRRGGALQWPNCMGHCILESDALPRASEGGVFHGDHLLEVELAVAGGVDVRAARVGQQVAGPGGPGLRAGWGGEGGGVGGVGGVCVGGWLVGDAGRWHLLAARATAAAAQVHCLLLARPCAAAARQLPGSCCSPGGSRAGRTSLRCAWSAAPGG